MKKRESVLSLISLPEKNEYSVSNYKWQPLPRAHAEAARIYTRGQNDGWNFTDLTEAKTPNV